MPIIILLTQELTGVGRARLFASLPHHKPEIIVVSEPFDHELFMTNHSALDTIMVVEPENAPVSLTEAVRALPVLELPMIITPDELLFEGFHSLYKRHNVITHYSSAFSNDTELVGPTTRMADECRTLYTVDL
jgi:hypothetical protein